MDFNITHKALLNIYPNTVTIDNKTPFTEDGVEIEVDSSLLDVEVVRLTAEYDNAQYSRDRAEAYPPMADQLDDIFHNGVAGWKETIQAVKDTYPKP